MTRHRLVASQTVARPLEEVFAFFARPENLGRITPPAMGFEQVSTDLEMRAGVEIEHRITPLPGLTTTWRSRIAEYDPPHGFVDVQLRGPYRRWEHRHTFRAVDGGTLVEDAVEYELPLGPLGNAVASRLVAAELRQIFRYRAQALEAIFEPVDHASDAVELAVSRMRVAVAGGTGFVGGAIARELRRRGQDVVVLSHRGEAARGWLPDDVEIRAADVTTGDGLAEALADRDALVIALA
ncbi:MAG TPA: SRPBCC family protein, partial [Candidatus Limnocylindrales bacterium]